jgi:hypothetical protein
MPDRLEKLRALRDSGALSEQEFLVLRESALSELTGAGQTKPDFELGAKPPALPVTAPAPVQPESLSRGLPVAWGVVAGLVAGFLIARTVYHSRPATPEKSPDEAAVSIGARYAAQAALDADQGKPGSPRPDPIELEVRRIRDKMRERDYQGALSVFEGLPLSARRGERARELADLYVDIRRKLRAAK